MVGDLFRPAHGAEEDGVVMADLVLPVARQHLAVLQVVVAGGEVEFVELEFEVVPLCSSVKDAHAFRDDFLANSVAGDDGDSVGAVLSSCLRHD